MVKGAVTLSAYLFQNILFTPFYWSKVRFWLFLKVLTRRLPQSPPEGTGKTAVPSSPSQMEERAKNAIQRYGNAILRLGCSYLRNASDAEDILQESLLKLIYTAPEFCSEEHEKAWLFRVAINLCKNKIKYNRRREYEELSETLPYETPEDLSFVWEAVEALPIRYREVIPGGPVHRRDWKTT